MATATLEDTLDKLNSSLDRIANVLSGSNKKNQETRKEMVSRFKGTFQDDPITRLAKAIESNQSISPTKLSGTNVEGEKEGSSFLTKLLGGLIVASGIGIAIREFLQTEEGQKLKKELGTYFDEVIKPVFGKVGDVVAGAALDAGKAFLGAIASGVNNITDSISKAIRQGVSDGFSAAKAYIDNLFNKLTPGLSNITEEEQTDIATDLTSYQAAAAGLAAKKLLDANKSKTNKPNTKLSSYQAAAKTTSPILDSKGKPIQKAVEPKIEKNEKPIVKKIQSDNSKAKKSESRLKKALNVVKGTAKAGLAGIVSGAINVMLLSERKEDIDKTFNRIINSKGFKKLNPDEQAKLLESLEAAREHQKDLLDYRTGVGVASTIGSVVAGIFSSGLASFAAGIGIHQAGNTLIDAFTEGETLDEIEQRMKSGNNSSIIPDKNVNPQNYSAVSQESTQIAALTENGGGGSGGGNVNKTDITKIDNNNQVMASKFKPTDREQSFDTYIATYA